MTPKEKADSIIDKFRIYVVMWSGGMKTEQQNLKQCALIAVEEIILQFDSLHKPEYTSFYASDISDEVHDGCFVKEYWEEVKEEINKL